MGIHPTGGSRVYVHTLGCPKNEADSRAVLRALTAAGVEVGNDPAEATHILLNTCGFIREAKEESIAAILDAACSFPEKKVLVMGCLVERYRDELTRDIPEVAAWFGLAGGPDERELIQLLRGDGPEAAEEGGAVRMVPAVAALPAGVRAGEGGGAARSSYAYVKISDGCDEACSFCAIPGIKGAYHAAEPRDIVADAAACLAEGARELVLVGQDTARWESGRMDLVGLAEAVAADPQLSWLRIMYLQPEHVSDTFLEHMGRGGRLCAYLDIPLQHSHPDVLRRMGRAGDGDSYLELLAKARRLVPGVAVRSAFIVGFPGETEAHFEHLLDFVREAEFDYAGGFIYSPEEGTPAARMRPQVPRRVARERLIRLNRVLAEVAERIHCRGIGSAADVMIDTIGGADQSGSPEAVGRTRGQAPEVDGVVYIEGELPDGVRVGDVIRVTIDAAIGYDFVGTCGSPGGD